MFSSKGRRVFGDKKEVRGQIWSKRSDRQTDKKINGQRNRQNTFIYRGCCNKGYKTKFISAKFAILILLKLLFK